MAGGPRNDSSAERSAKLVSVEAAELTEPREPWGEAFPPEV